MKFKKIILTMACTISVLTTVLPVSAANTVMEDIAVTQEDVSVASTCSCVKDLVQVRRTSCVYENVSAHRSVYIRTYNCAHGFTNVTEEVIETHAYHWVDAGHETNTGGDIDKHIYSYTCSGCGYVKESKKINCYYKNTGSHALP